MISKGSARRETSPCRWAVGRSQAIKAIASGFLAKHPGHLASEFKASLRFDVLDVVFIQHLIHE